MHVDSYLLMHLQIELMHLGISRYLHLTIRKFTRQSKWSSHETRTAMSNNNKVFFLKEWNIMCNINKKMRKQRQKLLTAVVYPDIYRKKDYQSIDNFGNVSHFFFVYM